MERDTVRSAINKQFNKLFTTTETDEGFVMKPNICGVCDEFISLSDLHILSFKILRESHALLGKRAGNTYHEGCSDYYFDGSEYDSSVPWDRIFLSPGTQVRRIGNNNDEHGILSCGKCRDSMHHHVIPKMAIANGF